MTGRREASHSRTADAVATAEQDSGSRRRRGNGMLGFQSILMKTGSHVFGEKSKWALSLVGPTRRFVQRGRCIRLCSGGTPHPIHASLNTASQQPAHGVAGGFLPAVGISYGLGRGPPAAPPCRQHSLPVPGSVAHKKIPRAEPETQTRSESGPAGLCIRLRQAQQDEAVCHCLFSAREKTWRRPGEHVWQVLSGGGGACTKIRLDALSAPGQAAAMPHRGSRT